MKTVFNHAFIELTNLLRLEINHAHIGRFSTAYRGSNSSPYNRLFVIGGGASDRPSWFINHSVVPAHKVDLCPGRSYFMPGGIELQFNFEPGLEIGGYHFSLEVFPGFDLFAGEVQCHELKGHRELNAFILEHAFETRDMGMMAAVRGALLCLASSCCRRTAEDIREIIAVGQEFEPLVNYIEQHGTAQTKLADLAEVMGLNSDQLRKRFVRRTGIPLKRYLTSCLTRKATEHLLLSDKLVYEVAELLEFSSEYYFSRFFKKQTGLSPTRYRRNVLISG